MAVQVIAEESGRRQRKQTLFASTEQPISPPQTQDRSETFYSESLDVIYGTSVQNRQPYAALQQNSPASARLLVVPCHSYKPHDILLHTHKAHVGNTPDLDLSRNNALAFAHCAFKLSSRDPDSSF